MKWMQTLNNPLSHFLTQAAQILVYWIWLAMIHTALKLTPKTDTEHNVNMAILTFHQTSHNGILELHIWEQQYVLPWAMNNKTVGGYVLVSHANVSYITHYSYDCTSSLPQTIQPTRLPPLLPLFLILLFSSAKWKQIWRWYTSTGNKRAWAEKRHCYSSQARPGQAGPGELLLQLLACMVGKTPYANTSGASLAAPKLYPVPSPRSLYHTLFCFCPQTLCLVHMLMLTNPCCFST